ncbi:hypothetical protein A5662_26400 [Mycobacteriaceae bacterium 1482268.1]|nr:hypothetical protein A5662_26400 [Mycobacteriaceae bacterium 1482268.1]
MAFAAVAATAGCGLLGTEPSEPAKTSGRIMIGYKSEPTQSVTCTQVDQQLTIRAVASPGNARVQLELGADKPSVKTVNIENIGGLNGIAGAGNGKAEARANGSSAYKITGTAVVSDPGHPTQTQNLPFSIEAPC